MHKAIRTGKAVGSVGKDLVTKSGKAVIEFSQLIGNTQSLQKMGISNEMVGKLIQIIVKYGDFDTIMESINAFGKLQAIQSEIKTTTLVKQDLEVRVESLTSEVKELQDRKKAHEEPLILYQRLATDGFNGSTLERLKESSEKYGGPRQVLEAISRYADINELADAIKDEKNKAEAVQAERAKLDADYVHLAKVTAICDKLLQLGFSISAIQQIHDAATRYGEPLEVLKAIDGYGRLHEIQAEIANESITRDSLKAKVNELQEKLVTLTGQTSAVEEVIQQTLNSMNSKLMNAATTATEDIVLTFKEEARKLTKINDEYAETSRNAALLQEELKLARIIQGLSRYPVDIQVSLQHATTFLDLAAKVLRAKGMNPKVGNTDLSVLELITVAMNQLNPAQD
jgi:hypothetical protein